ncbi:MAG: T9SS type A sorting domain-containing protein [candidate division Zixibacteria bacterium]|nr:T9SS type A sorting domain-containing protein [candidate division Zixibacteria bacterium]
MFDIDQDGFFESCDDFNFKTLPSDFPIALDTGDVIHTVPAPVSGCQGLTWDGENLWVSSNHHAFHYKVSPVDGAVLATIPAPNDYVEGLAWDGTYLWSVDNDGNGGDGDHVYKLDPSTGDIVESFTSSITWTHGITWDGEYLWFNDFSTHMIYKVDSSNDQILHSFAAPGDQSIGLTWDGAYLWSDNFNTDSLYQIDPADGSIIRMVRSPHTNPRDMAWDGQYLWVVSWASSTIYQVDIGQTSVKDTELLPERFGLEGNYPNPFNANTTIEYTLPEASNVTLEVYTILGQKTATLVNEYQDAGHHTVNWQASNITSGIYYYRIVAGDITQARRMLLLK